MLDAFYQCLKLKDKIIFNAIRRRIRDNLPLSVVISDAIDDAIKHKGELNNHALQDPSDLRR